MLTEATPSISLSAYRMRDTKPRTTTASSTSITRTLFVAADAPGVIAPAPELAFKDCLPLGDYSKPTWVNLAWMISLSKGFMMYSLAPASIAF